MVARKPFRSPQSATPTPGGDLTRPAREGGGCRGGLLIAEHLEQLAADCALGAEFARLRGAVGTALVLSEEAATLAERARQVRAREEGSR